MMKKYLINKFDPEYFKVGETYYVVNGSKEYNMLITSFTDTELCFVYVDEEKKLRTGNLKIEDYIKPEYDVQHLISTLELCNRVRPYVKSMRKQMVEEFESESHLTVEEN